MEARPPQFRACSLDRLSPGDFCEQQLHGRTAPEPDKSLSTWISKTVAMAWLSSLGSGHSKTTMRIDLIWSSSNRAATASVGLISHVSLSIPVVVMIHPISSYSRILAALSRSALAVISSSKTWRERELWKYRTARE